MIFMLPRQFKKINFPKFLFPKNVLPLYIVYIVHAL